MRILLECKMSSPSLVLALASLAFPPVSCAAQTNVPAPSVDPMIGMAEGHAPGHSRAQDDRPDGARATEPDAGFLDGKVAADYMAVRFADLFVAPVGPKGLQYTTTARELENQRVRMTGFMVRQINADPSVFMFTEAPFSTLEQEYGIADGIPHDVVHALLPPRAGYGSAWQPYAVTVFGRLELGGRQEADGRISYVRIHVDHVTVGAKHRRIDLLRPLDRRDVNLGPHRHHH